MEFRDLKLQYKKLKPEIDRAILKTVSEASFIGGVCVQELEEKLASFVGKKYCITCGNGTDALSLALEAWGIGAGDAVFVPDFTFFSSGECPASTGAMPIFVDIDERTYNMNPICLENAIRQVLEEGRYIPRVVLTVDLFGQPAEYDRIRETCVKYGLYLLEDGAQGFGGAINEEKACSFGDITTTSFFPAKPLGCYGDGGAIFTDNEEWKNVIRSLAVHGKNAEDKYDNIRLGRNSRLDAMQAAVLQVKLKAFQEYELERVNQVADWYGENLSDTGMILPFVKENYVSSWAQYTVQLPAGIDREALQEYLRKKDIPTMVYYRRPMHLQGAFRNMDSKKATCPVTERVCRSVLSLPMHPYMKEEEVKQIAVAIREYVFNYGEITV